MTEKEKYEIKRFIEHHNKMFKPYYQINENEVFVDDDCEMTQNVLNLIMNNEGEILEYFNFYVFLRPLIKKLARKLFYYGKMRADDCLYYLNIDLR